VTGTSDDEAAMQLDLYLDRVLAGDPGSMAAAGPRTDGTLVTSVAPELAHAAVQVADGATRFHPSFRFEERLAARLRDAVVGLERGVTSPGIVVPFAPGPGLDRSRSRYLGGVLVGGAIASGVSIASLAGAAAVVVWRRARWERLV
jgi:hypothetical protein